MATHSGLLKNGDVSTKILNLSSNFSYDAKLCSKLMLCTHLFNLVVLYAYHSVCIYMNISVNIRDTQKIVKDLGIYQQNYLYLIANYSRLFNMVQNKCLDKVACM